MDVFLPTLPPYISDTSISFFLGVGGEGEVINRGFKGDEVPLYLKRVAGG
jgi:hypothetical protein